MSLLSATRPLTGRVRGFAPRRLRPVRLMVGAAVLAVVVLGWIFFAPLALGGRASYVVTDGISMLPKFHANGLVITQKESDYHVGEVVAYHNHDLRRVVMHRIVAMDGKRYVFKGDNNDFRDSYHAKRSDLVGKEWIYWPGGGVWLNRLRSPVTFALILAAVAFFAFRAPRRNRHRRHAHH